VFGTSNDQPYNFLDPKTGQMAGIDSEMLAYVLKKLGIPNSKMVQADFSGLVPGLISSRFDTIADAMYITPKRLQVIAFSDGLYRYGEVLVVQGTYSQDWLLYETDWNWRIDAEAGGALRAMGDIGSHWMDMIQHVTGLSITAVCADLQTLHRLVRRARRRAADCLAPSRAALRREAGDARRVHRRSDR